MKNNVIFTMLVAVVLSAFNLPNVAAQGVVVFTKDGAKKVFPHEKVDSIVTYNSEEELEELMGVRTFTVNGVSFTMVKVEGGTFQMGATPEQKGFDYNERPVHSVTLSDYYIGETEVTQELWTAVMGNNPSSFAGNAQRPVEMVSWDNCQTFISKLNALTGENFCLPTEAQWEYAARGGNKSKGYLYSGSNTIDEVAWYRENSYDNGADHPDYGTHAVKTKSPNELGLYDMSGNVLEWCQDWFGRYSSEAVTNPVGPASGAERVLRGGAWINTSNCRVAARDYFSSSTYGENTGLRIALTNNKKIVHLR